MKDLEAENAELRALLEVERQTIKRLTATLALSLVQVVKLEAAIPLEDS